VAAAADGVSHPSHQHQQQADDEQEGSDDQAKMGVEEGGYEGGQEEPEDDKDDSEADHELYLVSVDMSEEDGGFRVGRHHLAWPSSELVLPNLIDASLRCAAGHPGITAID
jgi:hypothetical protein